MAKIIGIDTIIGLTPSKLSGIIPIGTVIPIISSGLTGTHSFPVSGTVVDGLMRADGQPIPGGHLLSGTAPNITSNRFIKGNTTSGSTGGSPTATLAAPHLPLHTHPVSVGSVNLGGNTPTSVGHAHTASTNPAVAPHTHTVSTSSANTWPHTHALGATFNTPTAPGITGIRRDGGPGSGPASLFDQGPMNAANAPHTHPFSNVPSTVSPGIDHAHPASIGTANAPHGHTASTGPVGSATPFNVSPQYITATYLLRVS
jgi:hypothetical protein